MTLDLQSTFRLLVLSTSPAQVGGVPSPANAGRIIARAVARAGRRPVVFTADRLGNPREVRKVPRYANDPRWITAKFAGECRRCKRLINKGEQVFYYPKDRATFCDAATCGKKESADFNAMAADESGGL